MDGIAATEAILKEVPTAQVVMLSVQGETDYLRSAMLAGARDFLTKPPSGDELMSTIRRVYEMGKTRAPMMPASAVGPAVAVERGLGDVIAVFSPKGGVGCTTIAVNMAIALQEAVGDAQKIGLMDTSIQFGDVRVMLNLQSGLSMTDLVPHIEELDVEVLNSVLTPHGSGIKALLAPPHPEEAETLLITQPPEGAEENSVVGVLLRLMREEFDVVVVDMWSWVDDLALTVFDAAKLIVLVVMPNIPSIKSARLFLEVADRLNYPRSKIALVVNGVDRRMGIRVEQIEQAMVPVVAQIPLDEQAVLTAVNHGVPFVTRDQSRPISQGIIQLAQHIQDALVAKEEEEEEQEEAAAGAGRRRRSRVFG
jgi:pilus assembly protein CpaE